MRRHYVLFIIRAFQNISNTYMTRYITSLINFVRSALCFINFCFRSSLTVESFNSFLFALLHIPFLPKVHTSQFGERGTQTTCPKPTNNGLIWPQYSFGNHFSSSILAFSGVFAFGDTHPHICASLCK